MEIKINYTNNLSAARYFGAFGVQHFGFSLDVLNSNHVSLSAANEIVSWLYQPNIILEVANHQTLEEIQFLQEQFKFSSLEIDIKHTDLERILVVFNHVWLRLDLNQINEFNFHQPKYNNCVFIINIDDANFDADELNKIFLDKTVFLDVKHTQILDAVITKTNIKNLCINCAKEIAVGEFDVDEYENYLPYLEEIY